MMFLTKPSRDVLQPRLDAQRDEQLNYPEAGLTLRTPPSRFSADRTEIELGSGDDVFRLAVEGLKSWRHFETGWTELCWDDVPVETGNDVGVLARVFGVWMLNFCRVVQVVETDDEFSFAYGALAEHAETGEDRFSVKRMPDGSTRYEIYAVSRPRQWLVWMGYPVTRVMQRRFRADSAAALQRYVTQRLSS
ncbi:MAG: DUF1990 domain-containing protein [Planctomycetales bacterium]